MLCFVKSAWDRKRSQSSEQTDLWAPSSHGTLDNDLSTRFPGPPARQVGLLLKIWGGQGYQCSIKGSIFQSIHLLHSLIWWHPMVSSRKILRFMSLKVKLEVHYKIISLLWKEMKRSPPISYFKNCAFKVLILGVIFVWGASSGGLAMVPFSYKDSVL